MENFSYVCLGHIAHKKDCLKCFIITIITGLLRKNKSSYSKDYKNCAYDFLLSDL